MSPPLPFAVRASRPDDGTLVLAVSGDLDIATVPQLHEAYVAQARDLPPACLVLDLSETRFADSSAIAEILRLEGAMLVDGARLVVRGPSRAVLRVLQLSGLDQHLTIEDA